MEVIQRAVLPALHVEIPMATVVASTTNPSVVQDCLQANLDTAVGVDTSSLDPKEARILPEVVAATWEVYRLREILTLHRGFLATLRNLQHKID
jgi:hypothetical protein